MGFLHHLRALPLHTQFLSSSQLLHSYQSFFSSGMFQFCFVLFFSLTLFLPILFLLFLSGFPPSTFSSPGSVPRLSAWLFPILPLLLTRFLNDQLQEISSLEWTTQCFPRRAMQFLLKIYSLYISAFPTSQNWTTEAKGTPVRP